MTDSSTTAELADVIWEYEAGGGGFAARERALANWRDAATRDELHVELLRCDLSQYSLEVGLEAALAEAASELGNQALIVELCRGFYEDTIATASSPSWNEFSSLGLEAKTLRINLPGDEHYLGQLIAGRFLIERRLGHGGFGVVFQGKDTLTEEPVALKSLRQQSAWQLVEAAVMLVGESWILKELDGQGYPRHIQLIEDEPPHPILVMQFVDGPSLKSVLSNGTIAVDTAVECVARLAEAVHRMHRLGSIHRDIKPENVIVQTDGCPVLIDLGLAVNDDELTIESKDIAGTRAYMAPECLEGLAASLDQRADIWSLGALMFEMLSGERLQGDGERDDLVRETIQRDRLGGTFLPAAPAALRMICDRCLRNRRTSRYSTAQELAAKLRRWWIASPSELIPNTDDVLNGWRLGGKFGGCVEIYTQFLWLAQESARLKHADSNLSLQHADDALTRGCDLAIELTDLVELCESVSLQLPIPCMAAEATLFKLYAQKDRDGVDVSWLCAQLRDIGAHLGEVERIILECLDDRSESGREQFEFALSARVSRLDPSRLDRTIQITSSRGNQWFVDFKESLGSGTAFELAWTELDKCVERFWLYEMEFLNEPERNPFA